MTSSSKAIRKGDIYYIPTLDYSGSIQSGGRPYMVVSNDKCNLHSPVIHVAPATAKDKNRLCTHVKIRHPELDFNTTILCEQVRLIEKDRLGPYLCTVDGETMLNVNKALKIQFDM